MALEVKGEAAMMMPEMRTSLEMLLACFQCGRFRERGSAFLLASEYGERAWHSISQVLRSTVPNPETYVEMANFDHVGTRVQCNLIFLDLHLCVRVGVQNPLGMLLDGFLKLLLCSRAAFGSVNRAVHSQRLSCWVNPPR